MPNNPNAIDNLIPAKKGEIRNPKGYPKGLEHSSTRLKRLLSLTENLRNPITKKMEGFTVLEQLDLQQIIKARSGDTRAYETIIDRLEGKPMQFSEINANIENSKEVSDGLVGFGEKILKRFADMDDEKLKNMLASASKSLTLEGKYAKPKFTGEDLSGIKRSSGKE